MSAGRVLLIVVHVACEFTKRTTWILVISPA